MRRRSSSATLALGAAMVAIAGCGGGSGGEISKSDYANKLRNVLKPLGADLQSIGSQASRATTKAQLESALRSGETALRKAVHGIDGISPPSGVADTQRSLVNVLTTYKSAFDDAEAAVASGPADVTHEPPGVMTKVNDFQKASTTFATMLGRIGPELKREGVPVRNVGD